MTRYLHTHNIYNRYSISTAILQNTEYMYINVSFPSCACIHRYCDQNSKIKLIKWKQTFSLCLVLLKFQISREKFEAEPRRSDVRIPVQVRIFLFKSKSIIIPLSRRYNFISFILFILPYTCGLYLILITLYWITSFFFIVKSLSLQIFIITVASVIVNGALELQWP